MTSACTNACNWLKRNILLRMRTAIGAEMMDTSTSRAAGLVVSSKVVVMSPSEWAIISMGARGLQRCAVGCLLTPETLNQYSERLETTVRDYTGSVLGLFDEFDVPELADVNTDFLSKAQDIHDEEHNWNTGKFCVAMLDDLARKFGLEVVVDEPVVETPEPVLTLA